MEYCSGSIVFTPRKIKASQERSQAHQRVILEQQLQKNERKKVQAGIKLNEERVA